MSVVMRQHMLGLECDHCGRFYTGHNLDSLFYKGHGPRKGKMVACVMLSGKTRLICDQCWSIGKRC